MGIPDRVRSISEGAAVPADNTVGSAASVKVVDARPDRIFFEFFNLSNATLRLKLQAEAVDNDIKGIPVPGKGSWCMSSDNIDPTEISVIAESGASRAFTYEEY